MPDIFVIAGLIHAQTLVSDCQIHICLHTSMASSYQQHHPTPSDAVLSLYFLQSNDAFDKYHYFFKNRFDPRSFSSLLKFSNKTEHDGSQETLLEQSLFKSSKSGTSNS